jgi:hypothetical protein
MGLSEGDGEFFKIIEIVNFGTQTLPESPKAEFMEQRAVLRGGPKKKSSYAQGSQDKKIL